MRARLCQADGQGISLWEPERWERPLSLVVTSEWGAALSPTPLTSASCWRAPTGPLLVPPAAVHLLTGTLVDPNPGRLGIVL